MLDEWHAGILRRKSPGQLFTDGRFEAGHAGEHPVGVAIFSSQIVEHLRVAARVIS